MKEQLGRPRIRNPKRVSEEFKKAVRSAECPMYKIAADAGIAPSFLSRMINGREVFDQKDQRIKRIVKLLNFDGPCFQQDQDSELQREVI